MLLITMDYLLRALLVLTMLAVHLLNFQLLQLFLNQQLLFLSNGILLKIQEVVKSLVMQFSEIMDKMGS